MTKFNSVNSKEGSSRVDELFIFQRIFVAMRFGIVFSFFILLTTGCNDEQAVNLSGGLRLPDTEVTEVQREFDLLLTAFESVKKVKDKISPDNQTDAGFIYFALLQSKLNAFSTLLLKLDKLDIDDVYLEILIQVAIDTDNDLKDMLASLDGSNAEKKALIAIASDWKVQLTSFMEELKDLYLSSNDLQQLTFKDTTVASVKLLGKRAASFTRSGQEGSVTEIVVSSESGQTPPIQFTVQDISTGAVLFSEVISQNFSYSTTWKKKAILYVSVSLSSPDAQVIPVKVKIIHSKKVLKAPDPAIGSVVRQLMEIMAMEMETLYEALDDVYSDQFISEAEGEAVAVLVTVVVNRFGFGADDLKEPQIYKYPQKHEATGDVSDWEMEALEKFMGVKETQEKKISEILKRIHDTQDKIIVNLK